MCGLLLLAIAGLITLRATDVLSTTATGWIGAGLLVLLVFAIVRSMTRLGRMRPSAVAAATEFLDACVGDRPDTGAAVAQAREWLDEFGGRVTGYTVLGLTMVSPGPRAEASVVFAFDDGTPRQVKLELNRADERWRVARVLAASAPPAP